MPLSWVLSNLLQQSGWTSAERDQTDPVAITSYFEHKLGRKLTAEEVTRYGVNSGQLTVHTVYLVPAPEIHVSGAAPAGGSGTPSVQSNSVTIIYPPAPGPGSPAYDGNPIAPEVATPGASTPFGRGPGGAGPGTPGSSLPSGLPGRLGGPPAIGGPVLAIHAGRHGAPARLPEPGLRDPALPPGPFPARSITEALSAWAPPGASPQGFRPSAETIW